MLMHKHMLIDTYTHTYIFVCDVRKQFKKTYSEVLLRIICGLWDYRLYLCFLHFSIL